MRLRQIEVFHAVYTSGSMTAAAELLHVSQPSVSKVLAHAEQELGYRLFERRKGKLTPTPEAHRLFGHVATLYQNMVRLQRISRNLRASDEATLRIAATPALGVDLLPRAIAAYRGEHPQTMFEVETLHAHQITRALNESRVDIGLAFNPTTMPDIAIETLGCGRFVALAPREIATQFDGPVTISDLSALPFIALHDRGPLGRILQAYIDTSGASLNVVTTCATYQVAKALVARGAGVTIVDDITARSSGHDDAVRIALRPALEFDVSVLHFAKVPMSIVTQRFVEHLKISLGDFLGHNPKL